MWTTGDDQEIEDLIVEDGGHPLRVVIGVVAECHAHGDESEADGKAEQDRQNEDPEHGDGDLGIGHR